MHLMYYAYVHLEKSKSLSDIASRTAHNLRASPSAAPNADPAKRGLNQVLVGPKSTAEVVASAAKTLAALPKYRKDAILAVELLQTASPGFFDDKRDLQSLKPWIDKSFQWAADKFNVDNILTMVLHLDEETPHIQLLFIPIYDGKLCAAHWFDGPAKIKQMQTSYAASVACLGLHRGERGSNAEHISLKQFYRIAREAGASLNEAKASHSSIRLPQRGFYGRVTDEDWKTLEDDLERYDGEFMKLRSSTIVVDAIANSAVGREAQKRTKRALQLALEADQRLSKLQTDARLAEEHLAAQQGLFVTRNSELDALDREIERRRDILGLGVLERKAGEMRAELEQLRFERDH